MPPYAVIVDPLSTGKELGPAFRARGVSSVAVLSQPELAPAYVASWLPENFEHLHRYSGDPTDLDALAATLAAYRPVCVIPGAEIGVELADELAERVLPGTGNPPATSAARRDKWEMARALADAGVPHLRQVRSTDPDEIDRWIAGTGLSGQRLVVKPTRSSGTDEVHIIEPGGDWRGPFEKILGQVNAIGVRNDTVLVQEFAAGTEYIVDLYSVDGRHGLVDVCRYTKSTREGRIGIYDRVDFLPADAAEVPELVEYTLRVADAVGIRNGCAHAEVVLTADGPRLLEIGARPAGGGHQLVSRLATGDCHVDRTVRHHLDGEFTPGYELIRHVRAAFLSVPTTGIWRNGDLFDAADALPTFHSKHIAFRTGDVVPATTGLFNALGWVILVDPDEGRVHADYLRLKELERRVRLDPAQ